MNRKMQHEISRSLGRGRGILWFNPGGNWGNLYRHIQENRLELWELAAKYQIPFISGPQSIFYNLPSKLLDSDHERIKAIATKRDLLTFRQTDSTNFANENYANYTNIKESPDMAFMIGSVVSQKLTCFSFTILIPCACPPLFYLGTEPCVSF